MQCDGSFQVISDAAIITDGELNWIACPVCATTFTLPSGGEWSTPTIPPHDTP